MKIPFTAILKITSSDFNLQNGQKGYTEPE